MKAYRTRRATGNRAGPLRHKPAIDGVPVPASRTGVNVLAACGTSVLPNPLPDDWDDQHPRACPKCILIRQEST